ncbi:hypothetical protein [Variovorax sp. N23]|uniref:hypothetical protein n=1 Tax=Variovorax sp. N23 TaxID=2980555 RepID=UPI0021C593EF|nr:hypothetical protein [Variovorax sp. N23]MCU4120504.1 hypothetical protein [Variovorax sp. N23]
MKVLSNWRSVRLWESGFERDLHRRHSLRMHGLLLGICTLLLMWAVSALQMLAGNDSLALRYAVTLGVGYLGYLGLLRWWAQRLVEGRADIDPDIPDVLDLTSNRSTCAEAGDGHAVGDIASGALEAAAGADEGAVVVVPVVAIFLIGIALVAGAGALALLYFGWDALLAVAVEIAFSYVSARAAVRVAREGWLRVAVKLTWKPLLGALLCAVLLGAVIDRFMPRVNSLPQAVRVLLHR